MNNMDNRIKIAQEMVGLADSNIKHYKTDIAYDFATLFTDNSNRFLWAIRDSGSHFAAIREGWHDTMCYASIECLNRGFFLIDVEKGFIVEISKDEALAL